MVSALFTFYRFLIMPKRKHAYKTGIADAMKVRKYREEKIKGIWAF